jgi:hypothetical protein
MYLFTACPSLQGVIISLDILKTPNNQYFYLLGDHHELNNCPLDLKQREDLLSFLKTLKSPIRVYIEDAHYTHETCDYCAKCFLPGLTNYLQKRLPQSVTLYSLDTDTKAKFSVMRSTMQTTMDLQNAKNLIGENMTIIPLRKWYRNFMLA